MAPTLNNKQFDELMTILQPYLDEEIDCTWREKYFELRAEYDMAYERLFADIRDKTTRITELNGQIDRMNVIIGNLMIENDTLVRRFLNAIN